MWCLQNPLSGGFQLGQPEGEGGNPLPIVMASRRAVRILCGAWEGEIGFLLDHIPTTNWYNVQVIDSQGRTLRLALDANEFEELEDWDEGLSPREIAERKAELRGEI